MWGPPLGRDGAFIELSKCLEIFDDVPILVRVITVIRPRRVRIPEAEGLNAAGRANAGEHSVKRPRTRAVVALRDMVLLPVPENISEHMYAYVCVSPRLRGRADVSMLQLPATSRSMSGGT